ncbi:MAG TPA: hemerythrin domain-containing protein [Acidimicrobiales bacterium]|nr:hemerythrin domain-containing protein [Acidimicrobiales bacterium]
MADQCDLGVLDYEHEGISRLFGQVSDPEADRIEILFDITRRLAAHISVEQSMFLPVARDRDIGGPGVLESLEEDYHEMQRLLVLIERRKMNSPDIPELVTELKDAFGDHIQRFAESLSAGTADQLSDRELAELRERMENADGTILSHPHPHMLSLRPISRLTTRLAARFDRARDLTVRNRYVPSSGSDREALREADPRLEPGPAAEGQRR